MCAKSATKKEQLHLWNCSINRKVFLYGDHFGKIDENRFTNTQYNRDVATSDLKKYPFYIIIIHIKESEMQLWKLLLVQMFRVIIYQRRRIYYVFTCLIKSYQTRSKIISFNGFPLLSKLLERSG